MCCPGGGLRASARHGHEARRARRHPIDEWTSKICSALVEQAARSAGGGDAIFVRGPAGSGYGTLRGAAFDAHVSCRLSAGVGTHAADQNEARQVEALGAVDKMFSEKVSGKNAHDRAQLQVMLTYVRDGDKVRVKSPDRLARSTTDLLALVEQLKGKGVALEFVDNPALNSDTPQGEFMLTVLAAIAQLERKTIRERQAEGIAIAKRDGKYEKAPKLDVEQIAEARARVDAGVPKALVARDLGVSRQRLSASLNSSGKYAALAGI
ncbi:recombinase family protein [Cryobacterium sp. MLB-32]|uniref:recombinase family protein n=1 Tax=Cryobacterium sp. MLB-32 TaxID=1529318 RepID=UPI002101709C|nr:recombinase family protein [Cryobacterium sp. MLB-32]